MQGKTVLITGADGAIGRETTRGIARTGATVVMACIDRAQAEPVCSALQRETGNTRISVMQIDLAHLASIRDCAARFSREHQHLHVLVNNAGIYAHTRQETRDGFERTMGTNYLGPFLLTNLLVPLLRQTPGARIVNVASNAFSQGRIDIHDLHFRKKYQGFKAYAASKLAVVLFTRELAGRLQPAGVTVNALHPGHVATAIWNIWPGKWYQAVLDMIIRRLMSTPAQGAQTSIYLATADEVQGLTGMYFDNKKPRDISSKCTDAQLQKALWQLSEALTGVQWPPA